MADVLLATTLGAEGFQRPVAAFNVLAVREQAVGLASPGTTGPAAEALGRRQSSPSQ